MTTAAIRSPGSAAEAPQASRAAGAPQAAEAPQASRLVLGCKATVMWQA